MRVDSCALRAFEFKVPVSYFPMSAVIHLLDFFIHLLKVYELWSKPLSSRFPITYIACPMSRTLRITRLLHFLYSSSEAIPASYVCV